MHGIYTYSEETPYAVPIEIHTLTTFTKIGINVTTGATGSPVMARLGIYKD